MCYKADKAIIAIMNNKQRLSARYTELVQIVRKKCE